MEYGYSCSCVLIYYGCEIPEVGKKSVKMGFAAVHLTNFHPKQQVKNS